MNRSRGLWLVCAMALAAAACTNPETAKREAMANGDKFVAAGKLNEAVVEYRNALRRDPRLGEARWKLAEIYEKQGNANAAFREFVRAADLLADRVDVQVKAGTYLLIAGQWSEAKSRAERALKKEPANVDALILRANAMAGLKDVAGAIRDIEEALKTEPQEGRIYATLGSLRLLQNQRTEAEAAFRQAVSVSPKSVEARLALANYLWSAGRPDEVEKVLTEARAINPEHRMLNRMTATFYVATRRLKEAEAPLKVLAADANDARSRLALADYYVQMHRPNEAVPALKQLAGAKATYGEATIRLAQIERQAGHNPEAAKILGELITKEPRNADALTLKSSWQAQDGDLDGAVASAKAAVAADDGSARAQYTLGVALAKKNDTPGAIAALTRVLQLNPQVFSAKIILSRLQLTAGNADAAVQFATAASTSAPGNPEAQLALARSLLAKHNVTQAEPIVRQLMARFPDNPNSLTIDGLLRLAKNDAAGARASFTRVLTRDPNSTEALEALLALDQKTHNLPAAVARIEQRVAANPNSTSLLMVAARTYTAAGRPGDAERVLKALLALAPANLPAYMLLGRSYATQGRLDEALVQFDTAVRRDPSQIAAATMAAMIVEMQNKPAEAQKRYEAIVATKPDAAVAANNLAWIYAQAGTDLNTALQLAQTAKAQLPDSPEINDTLGWVYIKKDLGQLAVAPLEESVAKDPKNAVYHFHLGVAYAKAGMKDKARAALQKALEMNPQFQGADIARKALADLRG